MKPLKPVRKLNAVMRDGHTIYRVARTLVGECELLGDIGGRAFRWPVFMHALKATNETGTRCAIFSLS